MGYPPVQGRFYTRYAPVRHSSSGCKQPMLPFDLHVLGLPLAFILSQDQTLHRWIVNNSTWESHPTSFVLSPYSITWILKELILNDFFLYKVLKTKPYIYKVKSLKPFTLSVTIFQWTLCFSEKKESKNPPVSPSFTSPITKTKNRFFASVIPKAAANIEQIF